jgi:hypothetical protein
MNAQKYCTAVMQAVFILTALVLTGCSGDSDTHVLGFETTPNGGKIAAKLVGGEITVSAAADDQQNPQVIYLSDKNIYFSVWEDWRNRNTTGADIYGKFLNPNGSACGAEFVITNAPGNQTLPSAAYRPGDKIAVVWQNSAGSTTGGYVQYAGITAIPTGNACTSVSPVVGSKSDAGYTQVKVFAGYTTLPISKSGVAFSNISGATGPFAGVLSPARIKPTTVKVKRGATEVLQDDGAGKLIGQEGSGTINYRTGVISITRTDPVPKSGVTYDADWQSYLIAPINRKDVLLSRKSPKITYDSPRDQFWVAWNESRNIINSASVLCFGAAPFTWDFGDSTFAGFMKLNPSLTVKSISYPSVTDPTKTITTTGPEILRNDETILNRLISTSSTATEETYTYEYFTSLNTPSIASDTSSPETLFAWEGIRNKGVLTCKLDPATGIISSTFATSSYDDGRLHIYGLFDKEFFLSSFSSKWLDNENKSTASNPFVTVDSVSVPRKFLVAWEDNRDGANTKIYGQLVNSGGGLYNTNKIISFSDTNGDGAQDANVANSRQTKPVISFDSVNQRYFVMWQDGRNGTVSLENLDIFGQYLDLEGSLRGGNYAIATASGSQIAPTLTYNSASNQFLSLWKDANTTNTPSTASDVKGQLFSLGQPQMTLLRTDNSSLEPALIDFGSVVAGGPPQRVSFKVRNSGDATLAIDCVSPLPTSPFNFENLPAELNACGDGQTLNLTPSSFGETTLTIKYSPTAGGTFTGKFTIKSDGGDRQVNLQGIGIPPTMTLSEGDGTNDGTLNYANVQTGQTKDITLTVTNNSSVTYNITSVQGVNSPFTLVNAPPFPVAMSPSATLQLTVRYSPTAAGSQTAQLTIITDKSLSQTVNLVGTGTGTTGTTPPPPPSGGGTGTTGTNNPPPSSGGGKGGCFIATAAYGSYLDPQVMVLRQFRDNVLFQSGPGTAFVNFYYKHSPPIADFIREHESLRTLTRWALTPIILAVKYSSLTLLLVALLAIIGSAYGIRRFRACKTVLGAEC